MMGQQDWNIFAAMSGYGPYTGMEGIGVSSCAAKGMNIGSACPVDAYQMGSYSQPTSNYRPAAPEFMPNNEELRPPQHYDE